MAELGFAMYGTEPQNLLIFSAEHNFFIMMKIKITVMFLNKQKISLPNISEGDCEVPPKRHQLKGCPSRHDFEKYIFQGDPGPQGVFRNVKTGMGGCTFQMYIHIQKCSKLRIIFHI